MSDLVALFDTAVAHSRLITQRPDNATLLRLYALFKQASIGDATGERPEMFDMVATAKYDAWDALSGMSRDDAMRAYIDLVALLRAG